MAKSTTPKADTDVTSIPTSVFTTALTAATTAKTSIQPYLPEMNAHTQRWASGQTIRNTGFLEEGLRVAKSNPAFVSTFVDLQRYEDEVNVFEKANAIISELNVARSNWTAVRRWAGIQARREFNIIYGCVRELHHRNIPPANALYQELSRLYANYFGPRGENASPCDEEITYIDAKVMEGKQLITHHQDLLKDKTTAELTAGLEEVQNG